MAQRQISAHAWTPRNRSRARRHRAPIAASGSSRFPIVRSSVGPAIACRGRRVTCSPRAAVSKAIVLERPRPPFPRRSFPRNPIVRRRSRRRALAWQRHSEPGPAARAEAVVAPPGTNRPGRARSRQGTEFAESRFRASRVTFVRRQRPRSGEGGRVSERRLAPHGLPTGAGFLPPPSSRAPVLPHT